MNDVVQEASDVKQAPACELFLWCTAPDFERRRVLARIAENTMLALVQDDNRASIEFAFEDDVVCVLCDTADRFTLSFRDQAGSQEKQTRAAKHVVDFIGEFADQILGDWHVKFDFVCRDPDNHLLNMDDFPKQATLREVVTKFCIA